MRLTVHVSIHYIKLVARCFLYFEYNKSMVLTFVEGTNVLHD